MFYTFKMVSLVATAIWGWALPDAIFAALCVFCTICGLREIGKQK